MTKNTRSKSLHVMAELRILRGLATARLDGVACLSDINIPKEEKPTVLWLARKGMIKIVNIETSARYFITNKGVDYLDRETGEGWRVSIEKSIEQHRKTNNILALLYKLNLQSGGDGTTWGGFSEGCDQIELEIINLVKELEARSNAKED